MRARVRASGFVSGKSTHADRIATIRDVATRFGVVIDPHTADGVKVGRELAARGLPLICIETALPAKFAATIREALGREPDRPPSFVGLEARPQRVTVLPADVSRVKAFVAGARRRSDIFDREAVRYVLSNLLRNLVAGLRVAFFAPIARLAFRIDLVQLMLLFLVSAAIDLGRDWLRTDSDRVFSLARRRHRILRRRPVSLPDRLAGAAVPAAEIGVDAGGDHALRAAGIAISPRASAAAAHRGAAGMGHHRKHASSMWIVAVFFRCVSLSLAPATKWRFPRALFGALLLSLPIWFSTFLAPNDPWFAKPSQAPQMEGLNAGLGAGSGAQSFLLDNLLEKAGRRAARRHRFVFCRLRTLWIAGRLPQGRRGGAKRDGRALGNRRSIDRPRSTIRRRC